MAILHIHLLLFNMSKINIYFCASISGGRDMAHVYPFFIDHMKKYGRVMTEHIGNAAMSPKGEELTDIEIYERDLEWLRASDIIVAEVSHPSLGVGYELAYAESIGKPILALFNNKSAFRLSAMVAGCSNMEVFRYDDVEHATERIDNFFGKNLI